MVFRNFFLESLFFKIRKIFSWKKKFSKIASIFPMEKDDISSKGKNLPKKPFPFYAVQ
jgi:hypothetical protein